MTAQNSGHLTGPAVPHIGFWYGDAYLGETRGHPADVEGAKTRLMRQIRLLEPVEAAARLMGQLENYTEAKVISGDTVTSIRVPGNSAELLRRLEDTGYSLNRDGDMGLQYVLMIIHDPIRDLVVGLSKRRGPKFLLGKLTFPGGRIEQGERIEETASREALEETGVQVPVEAWKFVCRHATMAVLTATSDVVLRARQCEDEPVFIMNVERQLQYARQNPELYAPDFLVTLEAAMATLG
jgi:8-oxo-dGTP pyrophosphatase MutT (NUDIX family)